MENACFCVFVNIEENSFLDIIKSIIEIASAILVIIGAGMGLRAVNKWKEKQLNATFSFYSRLKTKIKIIGDLFTTPKYKKFLFMNMLPESLKIDDIGVYTPMEPIVTQKLSDLANDTIDYLMTENNQMPISNEWNDQLETLLELLQDLSFLNNDNCFKWEERNDEEMEKYYVRHSENLTNIIKDIESRQSELTKKYLKKSKKKAKKVKKVNDCLIIA